MPVSAGGQGPRARLQEGRVLRNILIIVYLVIGVVIANSHHYFTHLNSVTAVLSALLAVVLWPLVLFGVNLHIK
jgi:Mn2+/Fe2+ NRAMP family transporter